MGFSSLMPPVENRRVINYVNAMNKDIISVIESHYPNGVDQVKNIAFTFKGKNNLETARKIWTFLRSEVKYTRDQDANQDIRLPNRFMKDRRRGADCKSFSLFAASVLGALKMPVVFRYASYTSSPVPSHVYVVTADENGNEIILDGVYKHFNKEAKYTYVKNSVMNVSTLSGPFPAFNKRGAMVSRLLSKTKPGTVRNMLLTEYLAKMKGLTPPVFTYLPHHRKRIDALLNYYSKRPMLSKSLFFKLLTEKKNLLNQVPTQTAAVRGIGKRKKGKFAKKLLHIANITALAPARVALLSLVAVNFMGMAYKFAWALKNKGKKFKDRWYIMGGSVKKLLKVVNKGIKKKPVFGKRKKNVQKVSGPEIEGIGAAPLAALLVAAGTLLAALAPLFKGAKGKNGESMELKDVTGESKAAGFTSDLAESVSKITNPENADTVKLSDEKAAEKAAGDDNSVIPGADSKFSFKPSPLLLGGALLLGAGLYFISKKK